RERLHLLVEAWRSLFLIARPDVLIVNYAPVAQLAARLLGIPTVEIGEGFSIPPHESPFPPLSVNDAAAIDEEQAALALTNELLHDYGRPSLDRLCDVLSADRTFLCTFREFDHYPTRADATYCGPLFSHTDGVLPAWKDNACPKLFAYLKADYPGVDELISRLAGHALDVMLFLSGASSALVARAESFGLTVSVDPIDMATVVATCDIGLCHSGPGTTIALLLGGKPALLLPMQFEQSLTARNVVRAGMGRALKPHCSGEEFDSELTAVIDGTEMATAARAFQTKYRQFDPLVLATTIAEAALGFAKQ
ncbi:MAG: glycosyltransferase, partial [Propionivibrio sp.]